MADAVARVLLPACARHVAQARRAVDAGRAHAEARGDAPAAFWLHRLAPDMLHLAHQVEVLGDGVCGLVAQLRGAADDPHAGRVFNRGEAQLVPWDAADPLRPLRALDAAAAALRDAPPTAGWEEGSAPVLVARPGDRRRFTRPAFLWDCVLPNLLFHATMVHALLRQRGVPLGKDDFLGPRPFVFVDG